VLYSGALGRITAEFLRRLTAVLRGGRLRCDVSRVGGFVEPYPRAARARAARARSGDPSASGEIQEKVRSRHQSRNEQTRLWSSPHPGIRIWCCCRRNGLGSCGRRGGETSESINQPRGDVAVEDVREPEGGFHLYVPAPVWTVPRVCAPTTRSPRLKSGRITPLAIRSVSRRFSGRRAAARRGVRRSCASRAPMPRPRFPDRKPRRRLVPRWRARGPRVPHQTSRRVRGTGEAETVAGRAKTLASSSRRGESHARKSVAASKALKRK
jgi:hypothetical protein